MRFIERVIKGSTIVATGLTVLTALSANIYATPLPITGVAGSGSFGLSNISTALVGVLSNPLCMNWGVPALNTTGTNCSSLTLNTANQTADISNIFAAGTGQIRNINSTSANDFIEATGGSAVSGATIHFDMNGVLPPPAGVPVCTPGFSGNDCFTGTFRLQQTTATTVTITLSLGLNACTGAGYTQGVGCSGTGGATPYRADFGTTLTTDLTTFGCTGPNCSDTIANVLAWEAGAGHQINSTWSATLTPTTVPEPISCVFLGSGLIAIALIGRRRQRS
jgi:hypothetical protein